ncbi:hypothetical protein EJB05_06434, partial [Eragrostis curvula]
MVPHAPPSAAAGFEAQTGKPSAVGQTVKPSMLLVLSTCTVWITLDLTRPLDRPAPSLRFVPILLPLTIKLTPLTYTS